MTRALSVAKRGLYTSGVVGGWGQVLSGSCCCGVGACCCWGMTGGSRQNRGLQAPVSTVGDGSWGCC